MNHHFLDKFKSIGFNMIKFNKTTAGTVSEWSYHPHWLKDKYFTLVLFSHYNSPINNPDFRLYIHNKDGSFYSCVFQSEYSKRINSIFDNIFSIELRDNKIDKII